MKNDNLWGHFDTNFPSNIVVNMTLDDIGKLGELSSYYGKPKQEIISALILLEWDKLEKTNSRTIITKNNQVEDLPRKRVMFRVSQQVKNRYNRLTYNTNGIRKSDYIGTWIDKEYRTIMKG